MSALLIASCLLFCLLFNRFCSAVKLTLTFLTFGFFSFGVLGALVVAAAGFFSFLAAAPAALVGFFSVRTTTILEI